MNNIEEEEQNENNIINLECQVEEPILIVEEESKLSEYVSEIMKTPYKKRFDQKIFALFEADEDMLMESLRIKNNFGHSLNANEINQLNSDFPMNLFYKSTFENKKVYIVCKMNQQIDISEFEQNDSYEVMGKFFPGEDGIIFEAKLFQNMNGVLAFPLLKTISIIQEEFENDQ